MLVIGRKADAVVILVAGVGAAFGDNVTRGRVPFTEGKLVGLNVGEGVGKDDAVVVFMVKT